MSIGSVQVFRPAATVAIAAGNASANVALAGGGDTVLVTNAAASLAFVRFGTDATVAAGAGDTPILPGTRVLLGINALITTAAAVLASGSGNVYLTRGDGSVI